MTNLVPEQRVDRNGKLVTRHVRQEDNAPVKRNAIPAPVLEPRDKTRQIGMIRRAIESAQESFVSENMGFSGYDEDDDETYNEVQAAMTSALPSVESVELALENFPDSTVMHVARKIADSGFDMDYQLLLPHVIQEGATARQVEYYTFLHDRVSDIYYEDDVFDEEAVNSFTILRSAIKGLSGYKHLGYEPPEDIFSASTVEQEMVVTLCKLRYGVPTDNRRAHVLQFPDSVDDDSLVGLVLERPDQGDRIMEIMNERKVTDGDFIRSILDAPSQSVSSGQL